MIKIGAAGCGPDGTAYLNLLSKTAGAECAGVYDPSPELARAAADVAGAQTFGNLEALVEASDAVILALDAAERYAAARKVIQLTRHVFLTAPAAASSVEAETLSRLAREANIAAHAEAPAVFHPAFQALEGLELRPRYIEIERQAQWTDESLRLSPLEDLMLEDLDLLVRLAGPDARRLSAASVDVAGAGPDVLHARAEFNNGCQAHLLATRVGMKNTHRLRIYQPGMIVTLDFIAPKTEILRVHTSAEEDPANQLFVFEADSGQKAVAAEFLPLDTYASRQRQLDLFVEAVRTGREPARSLQEACYALRAADEIKEKTAVTPPA